MQAHSEFMRVARRWSLGERLVLATLLVAATPTGAHVANAQGTDVAKTSRPAPPPASWVGLIGEYGNDNHILISERNGSLYATVEWLAAYPIREESTDTFVWPHAGLYDGERVTFTRASNGRATRLTVGGVVFPRRQLGPDSGNQLRITPLRPIEDLRRSALAAHPPTEPASARAPDLVEIVKLDSTIELEIRYATTNNFLGSRMYTEARAFMQRPAANAVVRANKELRAHGYGLLIHDAYRPWYVTRIFWDATPQDKKWLVANPASGSRHNRGCAVDLTLYDLKTGKPVDMVSTYDESTQRAYADYPGGSSVERWYRALLRSAMESQGFSANPQEWWHFDYKDWRDYPIMNVPFENIRPNSWTTPQG
ncbi:MAG: M15 family metallopeptidase [Gemmatimonadaceae bacterium]